MGVRIQELPETTGINKEDVLIVEDGQGTKKGTVQQLDEALGVSQLKEDLVILDESLKGNDTNYSLKGKLERGGISDGDNYDGDYTYRLSHWRSKEFILDGYKDITIQSNDDIYLFNVWILSTNTGSYRSSDWVTQYEIDGNDKYRIAIGTVGDVEFSEQDILSHISIVGTKSYTDKTLSVKNVSADAEKTGTEIENIKNFIGYRKDISDELTIYYGKNVYLDSGILAFEDSNNYRCRTDLFNIRNRDILVKPKDGIKTNYYANIDGVWSTPATWLTKSFYIPKNVNVYLSFGKTDNSAFVGDEPLADFTETWTNNSKLVPKFRLINSISQELVVSDNNNESGAMQGMCFDGENIWYYLSSINSLRKYNINTEETTQYENLGLGHGNDMTYNHNTRKLYIAVAEGTSPIVKTIDIDTMTVGEFELNEIDGPIASIAYSKETDEYVVIGGQAYDRDGNIDGWTRKQMVIYDKNFDILKSFILKNDYSATQGVEFDGRYIYFCKSFYNGSHNDKVYVYDINGNIVNSFSSGNGEVEAISKIDDYHFYIAKNENAYKGGYIYKATVTSESYTNIVNVLYEKYVN